ncbi:MULTISPECIES: class I SAM-dependent methyltransferase [Azospirillum]|uniref:Class I SAM-dependent methyltransferase n=2 Tax=Azospirillum brasilense TaxID=192 RepID=A0ABU4PEK4_AZOBR|nr:MULTISPECIES: class I SAM-dependent methyltransferase [Azospirillum]MDW7555747.1 class I SAM-dependent methyltransferase [Azospirillum brasilense]MDW7595817.1 class I SAM-dependent methyltransferase [Azospirillum brasilense]MDW7630822.1 class I SAM-dependent methyltransferase [Azospirillum brasilense]MDX5955731.1 class I SAM-dependent methyltransferase [Azospirillum brasilense]
MDKDEILNQMAAVVEQNGPWTAHDILLAEGISTMGKGLHQQWRVDWLRNFIEENSAISIKLLRILDLACLEGLFAIEFARLGAETVGIEIRDLHLAKAEFARRVLGFENCQFHRGDVRNIPDHVGEFDVIICAGILYHLDFPDCVRFLKEMAARSRDLVIIDSHFAYDHIRESVLPLSDMRTYEYEGQQYRGRQIIEHAEHVTPEQKAKVHVWASIDNNVSVWLDERDVVRIMDESGFRLVANKLPSGSSTQDRPTLVFKRVPQTQA